MALVGGGAAHAADERLEKLSPDDREVAERMLSLVQRLDQKYFDKTAGINGSLPIETLDRETDDSIYNVRVTRGPVIEKLGRMDVEGKRQQPGRPGVLKWGRFYSLDVHPKTPLVGMLHATIVVQFYEDGTGFAGGWLGVLNGTRVDEDMQRLTQLVDEHFASYDKDPAVYRKLMAKGTHDTVAEFRRQPDPSGVSFYGPPVFPGDVEKSFELVSGLYEKFVDAYFEMIVERQDEKFTAEDVKRQDEMRKRWLVDQLFSDPFTSELVPFEIWSLSNVPPTIKF